MIKILLLENVDKITLELLPKNKYSIEYIDHALKKEDLMQKIVNVDIIGIRSKTKLTSEVLKNALSLKLIACFCIGTNQVDLEYCKNNNIQVINSPHPSGRSVAELVISQIISLARCIPVHMNNSNNNIWNKTSKNSFEVRGKTLGIIGYGNVGSQLSTLAEAMGMRVVFYDINPVMGLGNSEKCFNMAELLRVSDFVSIHVPETELTIGLIGQKELSLMKKNSYLLNLSRGSVLDLGHLRNAIDSGHIAGCALDVYPNEPKSNNSNWTNIMQGARNTILTPHIGGSTIEAQKKIAIDIVEKIRNIME